MQSAPEPKGPALGDADVGAAFRRPDGRGYATVTVPSHVESIRTAAAFIVAAARTMQVPAAAHALFEGAIVEALNNAVMHGNRTQRPDASILCEVALTAQRLTVRILGDGPGFVLSPTPPPEWSADDVAAIPEGGFGIPIIRSVFPVVRTVAGPGRFGLEMELTF